MFNMRDESAFDVDDELSLIEFLTCEKRGNRRANVLPCVEMPILLDAVDTACDDAHLMHAMDDPLTMHALSTHVEEMNEEAPCLSTFYSIATMLVVGVSGAPHTACKRRRPLKHVIVGRGRPKAQHTDLLFDSDANNVNVDSHDASENAERNHA
ncbi:hypothetical protein GOP47_0030911 [Adiantum capillus-veneris]|nr:hypothetical protein GOP47_0030911 [Adiantum capillus-veneris]